MKNKVNIFLRQLSSVIILVIILALPFFVFAQEGNESDDPSNSTTNTTNTTGNSRILDKLKTAGTSGGYADATETSLAANIGVIINTVLSLLGILFIVLIIVGGFQWMTAGGNEEDVKKAQNRIKNAVIGLVIVVSAYAIWNTVDKYFLTRVQNTSTPDSTPIQ